MTTIPNISRKLDESLLRRAELIYSAAASLLVVSLHLVYLYGSGSLWRDEINSLNISLSGSWSEIWRNLSNDSFPAGWFVLLRPIALILGPDADFTYRILGVLVGLALAAVVIAAGRDMTGRAPVVAIGLLLTSAIVIRYGDSLRGYGVGMLLTALTYWTVFRYAERPVPARFLLAAVAATAGVQILYFNAIVVFAVCIAAAVACLARGARRAAIGALGIGAICAATLVPYVAAVRARDEWSDLFRFDVGISWIGRMGSWSIANSGLASLLVWYLALAAAMLFVARLVARKAFSGEVSERDAFHAVALLVGGAGYLLFLIKLSYFMAPWYFLALMVLAALAIDALFASFVQRAGRLAIVLLLFVNAALTVGPSSRYVGEPATNVDQVAAAIAPVARPGDLILVSPWEFGISWQRYYHGSTPWSTIPPVSFFRWHRYDLYFQTLHSSAPNDALMKNVDDVIARGSRVFVVLEWPAALPHPPGASPEPHVKHQGVERNRLMDHIRENQYELLDHRFTPTSSGYEEVSLLEVVRLRPAVGAGKL